ncbi:MAG: biotin carboxyl carrier domain-containing protein [Chloroflexi bacterium]|nr:biotin carboxyl carrier domain-containing protein [Chloroflexota bacterium]
MSDIRERANALVGELIARLDPDLRELELTRDGLRVKVTRVAPVGEAASLSQPVSASAAAANPTSVVNASGAATKSAQAVTAPLTGVFYRSPSPQTPPFVQVGSVIAPGDVVGLIEAMKLFNEIKSNVGGTVKRIAAENGQLVRAHQPLVELEA